MHGPLPFPSARLAACLLVLSTTSSVHCTHAPAPPSAALAEAQASIARASAGPAAQAGKPSLERARALAKRAERSLARGDAPSAEAYAYAADRAAQAAEAQAGLAIAQNEQQRATAALAERRAQGDAMLARDSLSETRQRAHAHGIASALDKLAPALAKGHADQGGMLVTLPSERSFARGTSVLLPPAKAHLAQFAEAMRASRARHLTVVGRVPGSMATPKAHRLTKARTQAVMAYLLSCGVAETTVSPMRLAPGRSNSLRRRHIDERADLAEIHLALQDDLLEPSEPK